MKIDDESGLIVLKANPISMVGVFPYSGKAIDPKGKMGLDPKKFYPVFRSEWELFDPKAIESFNGVPFQVGHETVGAGGTRIDDRPADGCIFNVRRSMDIPGVLIADFKIYTESVMEKIKGGINNLSLGYRCSYIPQVGEWRGQRYEFIQVRLRGNHVALVKSGRCGSGVRVYDSIEAGDGEDAITFDSLEEMKKMSEEKKTETTASETTMALDSLAAALAGSDDKLANALVNFVKEYKAKEGTMTGDNGETAPKGGTENVQTNDGEGKGKHKCPDCGEEVEDGKECPCKKGKGDKKPDGKGETTATDCGNGKGTPTGDSVEVIAAKLAAGHELAEKISEKVGAFDHAEMDEADVAHYACEKMGVTFDSSEAEIGYVKGVVAMMAAAPKNTVVVTAGDENEAVRKESSRTAACHADYLGE